MQCMIDLFGRVQNNPSFRKQFFSDAFKPKIRQTTNSINEKSANSICEKPSERAASYERASGGFAYQSKSNCGASVTVRRYSSGLPFKINSA